MLDTFSASGLVQCILQEDDILVLATLEGVADQVRDAPEETGDLTEVIHKGGSILSCWLT